MPIARLLPHMLAAASLHIAVCTGAFAQTAELPDGSIAIHYNRCDGSYDGWGLHTWKDGGIALPGITWKAPMVPTGKDDFGVYWQAPLGEYAKNNVNYIIHKGDTKEQGGRDMSFDGGASRQVWVNDGDRKLYLSKDDAAKARAETPCK